MKKKGILIFIVLIISMAAIFFAKEMQKKLVSNDVASKTESKVIQSNLKENSNENVQSTDKSNNSGEIKKEETKEVNKTEQQSSSNKVNETSKQSAGKTTLPKSSSTNTAASPNSSNSTNTATSSNSNTNPNPNQSSNLPSNFIVRDSVNDKILVSKHVEFNGETVADITKQNVSCKVKSGDYFYEIAGLKERSAGPLSGWCYFINGSKPGIGSGSYVLKKDDIIEWKFLKDGVNN